MPKSRGQTVAEKRAVDNLRPGREHAQRDLRSRTVMRDSKKLTLGIQHAHGVAWRCVSAVDNIARKNPGMAAGGSIGRFAVHAYSGQVLSVKGSLRGDERRMPHL